MEQLAPSFPPGIRHTIPFDTTLFVSESVHEVITTLFEASLLVLLVVFIFLESWRATLIPMLAVPVSLIGAFSAFGALGFSLNSLTLFALVLAIGLVVDDAIVVVEAVTQIMETRKLSPREATKAAMVEVSGPVVAIALVLISVFVPIAFLGGLTGQFYRQFALTLAVSVGISALVARCSSGRQSKCTSVASSARASLRSIAPSRRSPCATHRAQSRRFGTLRARW